MSTVAMSGKDTFTINNRVLANLGTGDCVHLTYAAELAVVKTGKNGNTIYASNAAGANAEVELRIIRGSSDDVFLNGLLTQQSLNFAGFILMNGEFVKKIGDGKANITADTYVCAGGIFMKRVDAKENVEGDVEQSLSIYKLKFSKAPRSLT